MIDERYAEFLQAFWSRRATVTYAIFGINIFIFLLMGLAGGSNNELMLLGFGGGLTFVEFGHRLFEHFRMRNQIIPDDGLDVAALGIGETLRGSSKRCAAERERQQCGSKKTERKKTERGHRQILLQRDPGQFW
jgi:hypothetical protein